MVDDDCEGDQMLLLDDHVDVAADGADDGAPGHDADGASD